MKNLFEMRKWHARWLLVTSLLTTALLNAGSANNRSLPTADGFHGIWYSVGPSRDRYAYKYSGGLGTYTHQTSPLAIYSPQANRTYFVYGGTNGRNNELKNYISYFDHANGMLARPREIRNVGGMDNHRNVTINLDDDGYIWVFGNSHGNIGTGNLYKSVQPHAISAFRERILPTATFGNKEGMATLSYSNPLYVAKNGFMMVYSQYHDHRAVHVATSTSGAEWKDRSLFNSGQGHYALARQCESKMGIVADYHRDGSLDNRTNLYYFQSKDFGQNWTTAADVDLSPPVTEKNNPALVHNYDAEKKLVYLKDLDFDADGNPVLFYLTVSNNNGNGHRAGPHTGGRTLHTAHWNGSRWEIRKVFQTDHNYDHGELLIEADGSWKIIGPFIDGPQRFGTGGEIGVWKSVDRGIIWTLADRLTSHSRRNHTYVRIPANAHPGFLAYWADGDAFTQSKSRLYFADEKGHVYQMPTQIDGEHAAPLLVRRVP